MAFLQTEWGQNWLVRQITGKLSKDLQTKITIKHVNFILFNKMDLEGVYVEDQKHDTLLSAGIVQVRITDFFFLKDKADVQYIGLKDAVVNFNRTDSVWNYHFLEDYFSSPNKPQQKKTSGIQFNLKKIVLENVAFIKKDAWTGNDFIAKVGGLDADVNTLSLSNESADVDNLILADPYFAVYSYTPKFVDTTHTSSSWSITAKNIDIQNGNFKLDNGTLIPAVSYFDGKHINFSKINGNIKSLKWQHDVLTGAVTLSTQERSGLLVRSLATNATIRPGAMIFSDLNLKINRSTIEHYFSMRYDSTRGMGNFLHDVMMEADFDKAFISSDDIAFFAPGVKSWKRDLKFTGHVKGSVDALSGQNMDIASGNTHIAGNVSLVGLPDMDKTLMNIDAQELRTTYADAVSFIPAIRNIETPNLRKLSYIRFKGTYTGFVNDFVTYGTLQTNLGTLTTDLNMKFPKNADPSYSGTLSTEGFQLGAFINSEHLGIVDFHGSVKGKGFKWQTLNMDLDGIIHRIQYDNYTYQNITTKGNFSKKQFNGDFVIKDPNADLHINGLIDLSGPKPLFRATAEVNYANLKALQLPTEDATLKGNFRLNIEGSSLEDLLGTASITKATLVHKGKNISFDSLYIHADYAEGVRTLKLASNEFDATVVGDFDLASLPKAFTLFLSRYYPSYITPPKQQVKPQTFTFDINTGIVDDYVKLIDPQLSGFNNSRISGSLNIAANTMDVDADVPHFAYKNYDFSDVKLKGKGDFEKLSMTGQILNGSIDSSIVFPETTFTIQAQNDISDLTIKTTSNLALNQANLSARIKTFSDGATVTVNPSNFILNGKTWSIDQGGELNFRKNTVVQGQLVLRESQQQFLIQTVPSSIGNWNDLHVSIQNLNLGDLSPFVFKQNHLEGTLTGEIMIEDPLKKFLVTANIHTEGLKLDADSIGKVDANLNYDNTTGILTGKGNNVDPIHHMDFDLSLNVKSPTNFNNRISLHPTNFELRYLERFLGTIFSNLQGYVTGNIDIVGDGTHTDYLAKVRLKDAGMMVNFTKVFYRIDDTDVELTKDLLSFNDLHLRDTLGNVAVVKGTIRHEGFKNMVFNISATTQSRNMLLLNTTYNDNQTFYGTAFGSGSFTLSGPQNDMYMNIDARASDTKASNITLPPSRTKESGQADFMIEKKYGAEMTPSVLRGAASSINYDVSITATPMLDVDVVLDELTGDVIKGKGTGTLKINSGTSVPLTMSGRLNIEEGNYLFTFQSVFKKPFVLRKGADNYIEWQRDPYSAKVNLEALYTAENVSFAPLITLPGTADVQSVLKQTRENVNVVATLTGELFHPNFQFEIRFPNNSIVNANPGISLALQQLEKNTNELNKQVTYLIVFNSFAPYESTQSVAGSTTTFEEFGYNTISGLIFNQANRIINQVFSQILKNNRLTLNFSGSLYNKNLIDPNINGVHLFNPTVASSISLGTSFFNGRAIFTVGGTFDVPLQNNYQQTIQLLPDVTLEILLNQTGSLRATFFYRQNIDYLYSAVSSGSPTTKRYGAGVSYNKEFDTPGELFNKKKKKKRNNPPAVIDSTQQSGTKIEQ